jgi:hypothetical protein
LIRGCTIFIKQMNTFYKNFISTQFIH